jgi:hypothetical protein
MVTIVKSRFPTTMIENFPCASPKNQHARPLPSAPLSTKYGRQSIEGYTHDDRLIGRGARNQEPDGNRDTRQKKFKQVQAASVT